MDVSRKKASKESYNAFTADSIDRLNWFITLPPPLGVVDVPNHQLIDIDEAGFFLKKVTRKHGRGHTSCRVRSIGHYQRNEPKVNLIMGIEPGNPDLPPNADGSIVRPRRWVHITQINCNQFVFADFINNMLTDIERYPAEGGSDNTRTLIWDNLRAHMTAYVTNTIQDRPSPNNFCSVDRSPYRPKMAPIEYCFCEVAV